jgi:hypothetical protein
MQAANVPVKYAGRTYLIEFSLALALYVAIILARPWLIAHTPNVALADAAKIAPALPVWLMFAAVWRHYQRIDEFDKLKFLQTLAIAFGIGSCAIVTYSFLQDAGLPALTITWAWPTLAASWIITNAIMSINNAMDRG